MSVTEESDISLGGGQTLHVYDRRSCSGDEALVVLYHHGTPNVGCPPEPLYDVADDLGIRWLSYDRPGYGGSTPQGDRVVGSAAALATAVADAKGIDRFAVLGHSGGGSHALASAALLPERVVGVVSIAGLAPVDAAGLDWLDGMSAGSADALRAAMAGREDKHQHETSGIDADPGFVTADLDALSGGWSWLLSVVNPALDGGPGGLIDDDLAYVRPWGCRVADIAAPTLLLHGDLDRIVPVAHGVWLSSTCPQAELRRFPADGHISVLNHAAEGLRWLQALADTAVPSRRDQAT